MGNRRPTGGDTTVPSRRRLLGTVGATMLATGLAGCGSVTTYEFGATPVVLGDDAREELGYVTVRREPVIVERSRTVGGVDMDVTVESPVAVYGTPAETERATAAAPTVGAVSTPNATVMDRSFNPLVRLSLPNLITSESGTRVLARLGLDVIGAMGERMHWKHGPTFVAGRKGTCLGLETTLESYAGVLGGSTPSVAFVHLTRVDTDSVVITAAVHGQDVEDPGRAFVAPEDGYLSPAAFRGAVDTFAAASAAFAYRESATNDDE